LAALIALAFADARLRGLVVNTLVLCASVSGIAISAGLVLAVLLARSDLPGRRVLLALVLLLLFTPLYLQAAAWQAGLGTQGALVGLVGGRPLIAGIGGAIWIHAIASVGWAVLLLSAALRAVGRPLEELALLDASAPRVFCRLTAVRLLPAVAVAAIWISVLTAGDMTVTNLFQVRTFSEELYTQLTLGESVSQVALHGLPAWLFTGAVLLASAVALERFARAALHMERQPLTFHLGPWRPVAFLLLAGILIILIAVPLASLVAKAGLVVTTTPTGRRRTWSVARCLAMVAVSPLRFRRELFWSFVLGALAATISLVLALPLAWAATKSRLARTSALLVAGIGLAIPGPIVGLAIIKLLNEPAVPALNWLYDHTVAAPLLALVLRGLPIVIVILWYSLSAIPARLFELARLDGLGRLAQGRWIVMPVCWPALAASWLAAFVVALGDLSTTILVLPPGVDTIALRLFERLHFGAEDQVAAISLALVGLVAVAGVAALWLLAREKPVDAARPT
jgi:iron(III) transport system permease protein